MNFSGADMTNATLVGAYLESANFRGAKLGRRQLLRRRNGQGHRPDPAPARRAPAATRRPPLPQRPAHSGLQVETINHSGPIALQAVTPLAMALSPRLKRIRKSIAKWGDRRRDAVEAWLGSSRWWNPPS